MSYIKKYINKLYLRFGYKTKYIYGALFVLAACIICCFLRFTESESENGSIKDYNMSQTTAVISDASAYDGTKSYEEKEENICVYVCGSVNNPGVYEAAKDARIYEIVDMAGGMTQGAVPESINMAGYVSDGQMIYIPGEQDISSGGVTPAGNSTEMSNVKLININTAGVSELMTLPGIGESRANDIIRYRTENGGFGCIEDIKKVSGIKDAAYSKIKDLIQA